MQKYPSGIFDCPPQNTLFVYLYKQMTTQKLNQCLGKTGNNKVYLQPYAVKIISQESYTCKQNIGEDKDIRIFVIVDAMGL